MYFMTDVHTAAIIIARLTKRRKKIIRVKHVTVFKNQKSEISDISWSNDSAFRRKMADFCERIIWFTLGYNQWKWPISSIVRHWFKVFSNTVNVGKILRLQ